jgi:hypothetical protein
VVGRVILGSRVRFPPRIDLHGRSGRCAWAHPGIYLPRPPPLNVSALCHHMACARVPRWCTASRSTVSFPEQRVTGSSPVRAREHPVAQWQSIRLNSWQSHHMPAGHHLSTSNERYRCEPDCGRLSGKRHPSRGVQRVQVPCPATDQHARASQLNLSAMRAEALPVIYTRAPQGP